MRIKAMGYKQNAYQACMYVKHGSNGEVSIVCCYIDDLLCSFSTTKQGADEFMAELRKEFDIGTYEEAKWFIGLALEQEKWNNNSKL